MAVSTFLRPASALFLILILGAFFRFWLIAEIPPGLYPDEAANGNNAVEALRTGDFKLFYPENNGREGLFINIQALSIKLFGAEPWALRIVSALFGTLTILGVYLVSRELLRGYGPDRAELASLLAAFFLATSYWHVNFSRIGFRAIMVNFLAAFGLYWLVKAYRTGKISSAILGGFATGLGFHTYIAFRFIPFALAIPIFGNLVAWYRGARKHCAPCVTALFLFAVLAAAAPMVIYFTQHPEDFFGRTGQVSIFSAESPAYEFTKSTALTLGMFHIWGDCNQRHNFRCQPELAAPVGVFFLIGLAIAIRNVFKRSEIQNNVSYSEFRISSFTLLAWFFFLMFPATLTREGLPHALRAIGMIAPAMIFAGLGAAVSWKWTHAQLERLASDGHFSQRLPQMRRIRRELAFLAALIMIWIVVGTYHTYFIRFPTAPETYGAFSTDLLSQGRYLAALPDELKKFVIVNLSGDDIRGVPAPAQTLMFRSDTFGERERFARNVIYVKRVADIELTPTEQVVILPMNGFDHDVIGEIRERFPWLTPKTPGGFIVFKNEGTLIY